MRKMEDFSKWLLGELNKRGWTQAELARRAEITPAQISRVLSRTQQPGPDTCAGIARALAITPEEVLRRAGYLPTEPPEVAEEKRLQYLFRRLSPSARKETLEYLEFRYQHSQSKPSAFTTKTITVPPTLLNGEQPASMQALLNMLATRSHSSELDLDEEAQEALAKLLADITELAKKLNQHDTDTADDQDTHS